MYSWDLCTRILSPCFRYENHSQLRSATNSKAYQVQPFDAYYHNMVVFITGHPYRQQVQHVGRAVSAYMKLKSYRRGSVAILRVLLKREEVARMYLLALNKSGN